MKVQFLRQVLNQVQPSLARAIAVLHKEAVVIIAIVAVTVIIMVIIKIAILKIAIAIISKHLDAIITVRHIIGIIIQKIQITIIIDNLKQSS